MKKILQFGIPLLLALALMWLIVRDIDSNQWKYIVSSLKNANYFWVFVSCFCAVLSHISRAMRWKLALKPLGYQPSTLNAFWSVMVGYIANLGLPRMGELIRSGALKKTDDVPIDVSFGTVLTERLIDLVLFALIFLFTIAYNFSFFDYLLSDFLEQKSGSNYNIYFVLLAILLGLTFVFFRFILPRIKHIPFIQKIIGIVQGIWKGIKSIKKVESPALYVFHTCFIWLMYYLMMYFILFALEPTANLGANGTLLILTAGTLGFIAPVQGGFGSYHGAIIWLMMGLVNFYNQSPNLQNLDIKQEDAISFAFLAHTSQTLLVIAIGIIALFFVFLRKKKIA